MFCFCLAALQVGASIWAFHAGRGAPVVSLSVQVSAAHPRPRLIPLVSRGQFPAISSLPAGLSQAVATPFFSWGLRVVPLPIFGSPAVSPSTELPSARLPPAHFSLRADTLRGSMQRHCGCAKLLQPEAKCFVLDRGDRYNADVQRVAIQLVGGDNQRGPLLVEHKQANIASFRKPPWRDAGSLQGHQSRAKDSMSSLL